MLQNPTAHGMGIVTTLPRRVVTVWRSEGPTLRPHPGSPEPIAAHQNGATNAPGCMSVLVREIVAFAELVGALLRYAEEPSDVNEPQEGLAQRYSQPEPLLSASRP